MSRHHSSPTMGWNQQRPCSSGSSARRLLGQPGGNKGQGKGGKGWKRWWFQRWEQGWQGLSDSNPPVQPQPEASPSTRTSQLKHSGTRKSGTMDNQSRMVSPGWLHPMDFGCPRHGHCHCGQQHCSHKRRSCVQCGAKKPPNECLERGERRHADPTWQEEAKQGAKGQSPQEHGRQWARRGRGRCHPPCESSPPKLLVNNPKVLRYLSRGGGGGVPMAQEVAKEINLSVGGTAGPADKEAAVSTGKRQKPTSNSCNRMGATRMLVQSSRPRLQS